jgi:acyl-coenzyme A thioesterase PaaI-like protein
MSIYTWLRDRSPRTRALAFRALRVFPPFLGAGIRLDDVSEDLRRFDVSMPLRRTNANYVGTHFGGSLYAMCDPWFMLILMENLGPGYVVWDKRATIHFTKPGRGTVRARFEITREEIEKLRAEVDEKGKIEPQFTARVLDEDGDTVAVVEKVEYVRRKGYAPR